MMPYYDLVFERLVKQIQIAIRIPGCALLWISAIGNDEGSEGKQLPLAEGRAVTPRMGSRLSSALSRSILC